MAKDQSRPETLIIYFKSGNVVKIPGVLNWEGKIRDGHIVSFDIEVVSNQKTKPIVQSIDIDNIDIIMRKR